MLLRRSHRERNAQLCWVVAEGLGAAIHERKTAV